MLRLSRAARFIVPNSSSPEIPLFLSTKEKPVKPAIGDVFNKVMEYDRRGMAGLVSSSTTTAASSSAPPQPLAQKYFSGSLLGATTTAAGILLFVLTFGYNVGKPVVDAHREYFAESALSEGEAEEEGVTANPVEEFDDGAAEDEEE